jgi:hypothetical protein
MDNGDTKTDSNADGTLLTPQVHSSPGLLLWHNLAVRGQQIGNPAQGLGRAQVALSCPAAASYILSTK